MQSMARAEPPGLILAEHAVAVVAALQRRFLLLPVAPERLLARAPRVVVAVVPPGLVLPVLVVAEQLARLLQ
jgi:hypothetical protein